MTETRAFDGADIAAILTWDESADAPHDHPRTIERLPGPGSYPAGRGIRRQVRCLRDGILSALRVQCASAVGARGGKL